MAQPDKDKDEGKGKSPEGEAFERSLKQILSVPKAEIEKRLADERERHRKE